MLTHNHRRLEVKRPVKLNGRDFYRTREACKLAGTNRATFLRWVSQGQFTDVEYRDRNGWRLFTDEDIHRLERKVNHVERVIFK